MRKFALAIHGGAGTILRSTMTPEKELSYKKALEDAIIAGETILMKNGRSIDAVEAAIRSLEDNPLFNEEELKDKEPVAQWRDFYIVSCPHCKIKVIAHTSDLNCRLEVDLNSHHMCLSFPLFKCFCFTSGHQTFCSVFKV